MTTCAGSMIFGVSDINRYAGGSAVGARMTRRTGLRHRDPGCVIDVTMCPNTKIPMTGYTIRAATVACSNADQNSFGVMTGITPIMNGIVQGIDRDPGDGSSSIDMTG